LDHEPLSPGDIEPDGPLGIQVIRPLIEDDPTIRSEVEVFQVMCTAMKVGSAALASSCFHRKTTRTAIP
ncbi:MAG: hypothetical protein AB7V13_18270, partial [Pseudorhodoplanes sp.]